MLPAKVIAVECLLLLRLPEDFKVNLLVLLPISLSLQIWVVEVEAEATATEIWRMENLLVAEDMAKWGKTLILIVSVFCFAARRAE